MPPPIPSSTHQLFTTDEILDQPAGFLREVMRALCADDAVRTRASILLSKLLDKGDEKVQLDASKPLLPPGVGLCLQCKQAFEETENTEDACWYHDGFLHIHNKFWSDWDHKLGGPIDTPQNRRSLPNGFRWSCCDSESWMEGCQTGYHLAAEEVEQVKDSHPLEEDDEAMPPVKRVKLGGDDAAAEDYITGGSGAAVILSKTSGNSSLPKPNQKDAKPGTIPEGKSVCIQCKELFIEGANWPRSCWFHDGYLDLDPGKEVWDNFAYDNEAEIDTDEMREEVPEGFVYLCCGESGLSKGCKWGSHISSNGTPPDAVPTVAAAVATNETNGDNTNQTVLKANPEEETIAI